MILITVELISANTGERSTLGVAEIYNDATGDADTGNYVAKLYQWGPGRRVWKAGTVKNFPRLKLGPWDLMYRALRDIVAKRNPDNAPSTSTATTNPAPEDDPAMILIPYSKGEA